MIAVELMLNGKNNSRNHILFTIPLPSNFFKALISYKGIENDRKSLVQKANVKVEQLNKLKKNRCKN